MYSKKYILEHIEEFRVHNPVYDDLINAVCYPAYFNVGERGWFLANTNKWFDKAHRIHTSVIENVEYLEDRIIVTTQNTRFTFVLVNQ